MSVASDRNVVAAAPCTWKVMSWVTAIRVRSRAPSRADFFS